DKLLGLPVKDTDWVVIGSTPAEMESLGYKAVGRDFPVFLHPETREEYALARTERKTGTGYKGFEFFTSPDITLEEDLRRRDLTINAMAEDGSGNLIDPYNGRADLEQGLLRHVSPAFAEDPLRVLRVARFAARFGFKVAPETLDLMKTLSTGKELLSLTPERVWTELEKSLQGKYPGRFILVLRACSALAVLFPEIDRLFGVPQPKQYHPEVDTGIHTLMVLNQAARLTTDTQVRFAALMHDLGKGETPEHLWPSHAGHEERGVRLVEALCNRYAIPGAYRNLAIMVCRHHLDCHRVNEMKPETIVKKLEQMDVFRRPQRFEQFLVACEADARGRTGFEDRPYPQAEILRKARKVAADLDTSTLAAQGLKGEAMAREIRNHRIQNVAEALKQ
ncbi:MAG: multifunctional CCA addition/repair protein, partial [Gammaproteobacteria bacterium]|nr:multifunctional CCA addition/repair protein [Gammaproteobacteria bacterium]